MRRGATPTTLTTRQQEAITAIVATGDVTVASQSVGVNRATLYRWLKQASLIRAVHAAEVDAVEDLSRVLVRLDQLEVVLGSPINHAFASSVVTLCDTFAALPGPCGPRVSNIPRRSARRVANHHY